MALDIELANKQLRECAGSNVFVVGVCDAMVLLVSAPGASMWDVCEALTNASNFHVLDMYETGDGTGSAVFRVSYRPSTCPCTLLTCCVVVLLLIVFLLLVFGLVIGWGTE